MRCEPKGWSRGIIGPISIIVITASLFGVALKRSRGLRGNECTERREFLKMEKRYVSIFTKESDEIRWRLPAIVRVCIDQDKFCNKKEHRHVDTVFWQDDRHTDFKECKLLENFIGDCIDEQGNPWRVKVFAKTTDEIPSVHDFPESSIPEIRTLLGE